MQNISLISVALVGLAIGSFLNVLIYRVPRHRQFWAGRSVCPTCGKQLKWYHNIPVVSYLFLRGRCGFCQARIPIRYPFVELLNTVAYVYFFWRLGPSWEFYALAFLASSLIVIFYIDWEFQIIPDLITLPGMALGLIWSFTPGGIGIVQSLIGLVVGGGALYLIALLGDWLFKKESMGGGDIKMAAMLGAFLGWQKVLLVFVGSAVVGLVVSVILLFFSPKVRESHVVPFGPFIALAAAMAILWGDKIISYYLTHFVGLS